MPLKVTVKYGVDDTLYHPPVLLDFLMAVVPTVDHHEAALAHHMILVPLLNLTSTLLDLTSTHFAKGPMRMVIHRMMEEVDLLPEEVLREVLHPMVQEEIRIQHSSSNLSLTRRITLP